MIRKITASFTLLRQPVPSDFLGGGTDFDDQPGHLHVQRELWDVSGVGGSI
jgi:hypothetical protein